MKIALLGYGKMGHEVEKIAVGYGHTIGIIFDNDADWLEKFQQIQECDVAIDFSIPSKAIDNIKKCFDAGVPIVVGTTGWYDQFELITELCQSQNGTLFYASNFSIGVNLFFDINIRLAKLMNSYPMYSPSMIEIHHVQKLDAPSGTAITLANDIIKSNQRFKNYTTGASGAEEIPVNSIREGDVTGIHTVTWDSEIDQITITHEARNRRGFALGAVMAADWVKDRKGIFTMKDMLNL